MGSVSLTGLFTLAYSVPSRDRISGPDWMVSQRFDVLAKLPAGATKDQLPELMQTLLEERFKLAFHRTNKIETGYALVIGPKGHKLEPAIPDDAQTDAKAGVNGGGFGGNSGTMSGVIRNGPNGTQRTSVSNGFVHTEFYAIDTKALAQSFSTILLRPVSGHHGT